MNEISKLYENAGCEKNFCHCKNKCPYFRKQCNDCEMMTYPPFTAEKQLFLFQWVCKKFNEIYISYTDFKEVKSWEIVYKISVHRNSFEECLCAFINLFWQDLSEEERKQIKEILE